MFKPYLRNKISIFRTHYFLFFGGGTVLPYSCGFLSPVVGIIFASCFGNKLMQSESVADTKIRCQFGKNVCLDHLMPVFSNLPISWCQ